MRRIRSAARRVATSDSGQDLIEYALLAAFIGLVSVVAIANLGTSMDGAMSNMAASVESSAGGS